MAGSGGRAEVHLWRVVADGDTGAARGVLSPGEIRRADAFRMPRDRERFALFRGALRRVLGRYLSLEPAQVPLSAEAYEKPRVSVGGAAELHFNLSHSGGEGLIAVCRTAAVGVDVEVVRPVSRADALVARFFSASEQAAYANLAAKEREVAFLRCWTRKEAYLKAIGTGIAFPPERLSVTLAPGEPARLIGVDGDPEASRRWQLVDCDPTAGTVAALAVDAAEIDVVWRQGPPASANEVED
jgi:4'-phosphopantetheinyl transferase